VDLERAVCLELAERIRGCRDPSELLRLKKDLARRHGLKAIPKNSDLLPYVRGDVRELLVIKRVRSASGITVIPMVTEPYPCPHGRCVYCPGGTEEGVPQSYGREEPAIKRALGLNFDPYLQVKRRMEQLERMGHRISKVELIVMSGTFLFMPKRYKSWFIKRGFDALNGIDAKDLEEAKRLNERAEIRNVGLSIETRPDWCGEEHVDEMLSYGATRVEIGVQILDDEVYRLVKRGHTVEDVARAFRVAKDAGFKIVAHMMPGLPGSDYEKDIRSFSTLFEDERFKPDMLKIYPTLVFKGTELYEMYKRGEYRPYGLDETVGLIADVKEMVPKWVRIMRIHREFPARDIVAGVKRGDLRVLVQEELKRRGKRCRCIRCREVGMKELKEGVRPDPDRFRLMREEYTASKGIELFLSYEDPEIDALIGMVRLRIPSEEAHRPEIREKRSSIVRELRVYGEVVPIGERGGGWQHRGYGALLMKEAERISKEEFDVKRVVVISAVGTREYYRKLGYRRLGPYMAKEL